MRAHLACTWLALAACGDKPGVYVDVKIDKALGVANVAVYIGKDTCTDSGGSPCGIAPPTLDKIHPTGTGGTFFRDANTRFTASASGGTARIHVEASGPNEVVQLVVLGLDANGGAVATGVARDLHVPSGGATNLAMTLTAAMPVTGTEEDTKPHPDGDYVLDWTSAQAPTDCVLAEHWEGGAPTQVFVVPREDGDCDGIPTLDMSGTKNSLECDPYWFDYSSDTAAGSASCATRELVNNFHTCLLGGSSCVDGTGASGPCAPLETTTCVADAICNGPCMTDSGTPLSSCVTTAGPLLLCQFYASDVGTPCTSPLPNTATKGSVVLSPLFVGGSRTCQDVKFAPVDSLYSYAGQLDNKLFAPAPSTVEVDLGNQVSGTPCAFDATWATGAFANAGTAMHTVAEVTVDNGNHIVLPVVIARLGCPTQVSSFDGFGCDIVMTNADNIVQCAR